jgi:hypothetical protein
MPSYQNQRHILRDRRPSTAACPAYWTIGKNESKYCTVEPARAANGGQKSLVPARQA